VACQSFFVEVPWVFRAQRLSSVVQTREACRNCCRRDQENDLDESVCDREFSYLPGGPWEFRPHVPASAAAIRDDRRNPGLVETESDLVGSVCGHVYSRLLDRLGVFLIDPDQSADCYLDHSAYLHSHTQNYPGFRSPVVSKESSREGVAPDFGLDVGAMDEMTGAYGCYVGLSPVALDEKTS
jgi:hypothetical protein